MNSEIADSTDDPDTSEIDPETELRATITILEEENQRLREEYATARQSQYRRTALSLGVVGMLALLAGVLFPSARTVLFALGGTGVFIGILTYYLTPEQFLPERIGRQIFETLAENETTIISELGLTDRSIYVPVDAGQGNVRLFVPQHRDYSIPDEDSLTDVFVVTEDTLERGISLHPTGEHLFEALERSLSGEVSDDPVALADQLSDALVSQFELVETAESEIEEPDRLSVAVAGSAFGPVDRFDHPVASMLAVGFSYGIDMPVACSVSEKNGDRWDYLVTCRPKRQDDVEAASKSE